ncbi:MAG TPA: hypothetical protein VE863_00045 [Pyrinomonadaceae bacterium]|jgi:hypothetical protein|nr:hypothetical protein [Pyrinomonadaceae bacterium]
MQTLNQLETEPLPIEEEERRYMRRLLVGTLCALILTGSVFGGYVYLRKRHERQVAAAVAAEKIEKEKPKVEVAVDEARTEGKKSILSGTLHNISGETLHNVAVELQLRRRTGGTSEARVVVPELTELAPDAKTTYRVELPVQDYGSATLARILTGDPHLAIAFKGLPGAERPPLPPVPAGKTIVVPRPAPKDGEIINTEQTAGKVP